MSRISDKGVVNQSGDFKISTYATDRSKEPLTPESIDPLHNELKESNERDEIEEETTNSNTNSAADNKVDNDENAEETSDPSEYGSNTGPEFNNKRIILQRFTIYNSRTTMYIVGSNAKESLFRILEIGKDPNDLNILMIIEDKSYFYTRKDMIELLNGLDESIEGGIHKIAQGYGLLGLIKFTKGYYLSIITKCSQVAILGGHYIYHVDETKLIPLDINYRRPEKYSDEERLLSIFKYLDLSKTFYFSFAYDITNTLQTNFIRNKKLATDFKYNSHEDNNTIKMDDTVNSFVHNERFVWNNLLLKPILENPDIATYEWFQPIIHGFIDQANISVYGKKFYITIIARRSHHYAGARFLKRGVNDKGNVANEIETEQIVSDMLISSFHDTKYGFYNNPKYTSFVQHRGSIPLYWTQDLNKLPKPPIEINLSDPFYQSSAIHFSNLFERYGLPIIVLNLIKTKEKTPRELKLNQHFKNCIGYLNQFLPTKHKLQFHSFDMSRYSKKNLDVIRPLQNIASNSINEIGFFHNGIDLSSTKLQKGVIRTNCIDCLDRTNAAQFIICKEALTHQLRSLGLIPKTKTLDYDSDLINILTEIFHDHGDTIAVQYGGSNLVNTMDSYRRINQWSSHTRDILNSVKRIYSNSFMDLIRQEAINLFLGNYIYDRNRPKLWELQNDFYLHNEMAIQNIRVKTSYIHWFNEKSLSDSRFLLQDYKSKEIEILSWDSRKRLDAYPDYNDNWFNECYVPRKYQSLSEVFQFTMNSNARYFPSIISNDIENKFDYSPFESRKPKHDEPSTKASRGSENELKYLGVVPQHTDNNSMADFEVTDDARSHSNEQNFRNNLTFEKNQTQYRDQNYLTNPKKIKNFLANKIEKLGYSGKGHNGKDQLEETSYIDSARLLATKTSSINFDSSVSHLEDSLTKPRVRDSDSKLYCRQWDIQNLKSSNFNRKESLHSNEIQTNPQDTDIYNYFTTVLINSSENNDSVQTEQSHFHDAQDLKLYGRYLGLDEEKLFDFNTEDDYFR